MTKLVFLYIFRLNSFDVSQSYKLQNSWFTINPNDPRFLSACRILVSSAKKPISLIRKISGPQTERCGTPQVFNLSCLCSALPEKKTVH